MIKIIQNDSIINNSVEDNSIVFSSSNNLLKLKKEFIDKEILITTLDNYINKIISNKYNTKLVNDTNSFVYMYKAFNNVKENINKYNEIEDISFIGILINTYSFFKETNLKENNKTKTLKIIYDEYEKLLEENNFITKYKLYDLVLNIINEIDYKNIYFENINELKSYEIEFINKLKANKNVYIYANTINNESLVNDLNKIEDVDYIECSNNDVNSLFKIGTNDLFKSSLMVSCNDLYEEVRFITRSIKQDINNGYIFKDILVVSSDIDRYSNYFKLLFNFPYYKKETFGVLTNNFIDTLFKILKGDFSCHNFISLLKLNILNTDKKIIDDLDNYVYMWNLEHEPFYKEFTFNPNGKKDFNEHDYNKLKYLNDIKESIINPIKYLLSNIVKEKNAKEILKYLFTYMDEEGIADSLAEKDYEGYNKFIELLEVLSESFDDINVIELLDIINECFKPFEKGLKMNDEVSVLNLNEYTSSNYKKVYFIGNTAKDLPSTYKYSTLINKEDLDDEVSFDLITRYSSKEKNLISNVLMNNDIIITYHKLNDSSAKLEASSILDKFGSKKISYKYDINKEEKNNYDLKLDKDISSLLYGNELVLSPSSLEVFAKCKYSFFLSYGLRLNIKEKMDFDNREVGTFVHFILEKCINNNVNYENVCDLVDRFTNEYFDINKRTYSNAINHVIKELKKSTVILLNTILDELNETKFKPKYTELRIKDNPLIIKLDNGTIKISGIVDRVDCYEDDKNFYYRIIDYKTGTKKFRLDDILNGLNMQMLIYLMAIKDSNITNKNIVPTGFLYYPALLHYKKEMIGMSKEEVLQNLKNSLKMNGILNKDYFSLYNEDEVGNFIDVKTRDNINYEKVLNTDELEIIFNKVLEVLKEEAENMLSGDISINPIIDNKNDSCLYCKFSSICKFNSEKDKARRFKNLDKSEVIKMIEGDINGMDI